MPRLTCFGDTGSISRLLAADKIKDVWLHRIFGVLMLWAAVRMLFR